MWQQCLKTTDLRIVDVRVTENAGEVARQIQEKAQDYSGFGLMSQTTARKSAQLAWQVVLGVAAFDSQGRYLRDPAGEQVVWLLRNAAAEEVVYFLGQAAYAVTLSHLLNLNSFEFPPCHELKER